MYRYETHLHTSPVSKCAIADVQQTVSFYKELGYAGIFVTNHFLDGNINIDKNMPYEDKIHFYFADFEQAKKLGEQVGLQVLSGVELSYKGTDFLIYGLDKQWFLAHPEIMGMEKSEQLCLMDEYGALIIQAHPFRAAFYIDHIRLFPRRVHGAEIYNAANTEFENKLAKQYAENFDLIPFAGTDNHFAGRQRLFGGMQTDTPVTDEAEFINLVKNGRAVPFHREIGDVT